jgi:HEPN domain-containing protein
LAIFHVDMELESYSESSRKHLGKIVNMELALRVSSFTEGHREALRLIEEAYVVSRYLAKTYEREDAEKAIEATVELIKLIEGVEQDVFS